MKAFFIGLVFLIMVFILAGIGILLSPFLLMFALILRVVIVLLLVIFAIWLLGKLIILAWESLRSKNNTK